VAIRFIKFLSHWQGSFLSPEMKFEASHLSVPIGKSGGRTRTTVFSSMQCPCSDPAGRVTVDLAVSLWGVTGYESCIEINHKPVYSGVPIPMAEHKAAARKRCRPSRQESVSEQNCFLRRGRGGGIHACRLEDFGVFTHFYPSNVRDTQTVRGWEGRGFKMAPTRIKRLQQRKPYEVKFVPHLHRASPNFTVKWVNSCSGCTGPQLARISAHLKIRQR
jgi:hypothetical protein